MNIRFPGIEQRDIEYAIECLEECKQSCAEKYGFLHSYFAPGGAYGAQWWQLDSSLALCGYKWVDRKFSETALLNFIESQKPNGRICLWGADVLPSSVAGGNVLRQTNGVSSLPKLFDVAYHVLQGSNDEKLKLATYEMLKKYLDWWFSARKDAKTGLITAVFEETFIPYLGCAGEYAPVDTNVEIYVACHYTGILATELGRIDDFALCERRKFELKQSINEYLWNEERGAYFPYLIKEARLSDTLMASTFFPLRMQIADKRRQKKLISLLRDTEHFNWERIPLTSVSMKDQIFVTTEGRYKGNASWSGNVWTLINETVIRGLCDCGENTLAAELAIKTVNAFGHNCAEFINPFDGKGHGVEKYAWTASQYLELIVEILFGISYRADGCAVELTPHLTQNLRDCRLELSDLDIGKGTTLDVTIDKGRVSYVKKPNEKRGKIFEA